MNANSLFPGCFTNSSINSQTQDIVVIFFIRYDLDLLVELNVDTASRGHFKACRTDCLNAICTALCSPAAAGDDAVVECGWQVDYGFSHWLKLFHPVLNLHLDVQVSSQLTDKHLV